MTLYTKFVDNAVVLVTASSSPGTGYATVASVEAAVNQARTNGVPLFIRPGTYQTTEIVVDSTAGGGAPAYITAVPGTVDLQLTSGNNLLTINGISNCKIENVTLDANNVTFSNLSISSAALQLDSCSGLEIINCTIINSVACGIYADQVSDSLIQGCVVSACSYGIWGLDSLLSVDNNFVSACSNNGIMLWTSTVTGNSSSITNNKIFSINSGSGTGQFGNGINVFRAVAVNVVSNVISGCQYSAIRCNGGGDAIIVGNNCYGSRENAIFIEAPAAGINFNNGVVSGNIIDTAGGGITIANSGGGDQGTSRSVAITGNQMSNINKWDITDPGYVPTNGNGVGIYCEGACVISGNLVDTAAGFGIIAGHNFASHDINVNANLVLNSPIGIGYGTGTGAGQLVISGNQIQGATGGAIVSVTYDDTTGNVARTAGSTDYGNQYDAQEGDIFVGNNRSY
ncbi:MAG: TIGR03808 family TAT-translocated repetitive protein [Pseudomonadota bacterium]